MVMEPGTRQPPVDQWFVGIGIRAPIRAPHQRHVAILYNPQQGETRLSHLTGDFGFTDERWDGSYLWQAAGDLDEVELPTVVARFNSLRRNWPAIPYGFRFKSCNFDFNQDGSVRFKAGGQEDGLTCSTFIVRLFECLGWPIADIDTWPDRPEDTQWARDLAAHMANAPIAQRVPVLRDRLRAARDAADKDPRVRPEELAGAFVQRPWPVRFAAAEAVARQIIAELAAVPAVRVPYVRRPGEPAD